ncbi:uncharacterized protein PSANT_06949 [Moesziomyces antarcticus]|uniref:Uncharacterized protein n=1 Tax=Pseudozyma antarctica TaxID=84753 RepID=A0A5C3FY38_PSEA2|nr:uncharacterized protein PSANT_06949 [Moesziomyces antarcticus]
MVRFIGHTQTYKGAYILFSIERLGKAVPVREEARVGEIGGSRGSASWTPAGLVGSRTVKGCRTPSSGSTRSRRRAAMQQFDQPLPSPPRFFFALSAFCRMSRRGFHAKLPWCAMLNFSALARSHGGRAAAVVASQDSGSEDHRMAAWDISTATMAALIQRAPRHLRCHLLRCRHTGAHHTRASTPRSNQHGLIVSFRNQARESELPIWRGCQAQAQALTSGPWFP